jgi:sulfate adenylyltransferase subunit 1
MFEGEVSAMNGLLKFITCGSVDDGKSTLIGHILYDAKQIYTDQEKALELDSKVGSRGGKIDYALLLDGLMAEREQGITIDVAYRYFTTPRRSFIVADTPGHEEYTRNMAVGASFAQLAVILVDATQGVLVQTRRHARICAMMGIEHFVFAVNKMDLAKYDEEVFRYIQRQIFDLSAELGLEDVKLIPLSATEGDNVTTKSPNMPWYEDVPLLTWLETVDVESQRVEDGFYMPVQRVSRPDRTFRGFQGQIEAGSIRLGDEVLSLPSGERAKVSGIYAAGRTAGTAVQGQPVTVQLDREVDVSRGCVLVSGIQPSVTDRLEATILWMDNEPLSDHGDFFVKIGTKQIPGEIRSIHYAINVNTGAHSPVQSLQKNELARCEILLAQPVVMDEFTKHRTLGELLLIDRLTNATSACGIVEKAKPSQEVQQEDITTAARAAQKRQTPTVVLTSTLSTAKAAEAQLMRYGRHTMTLENADNLPFAIKLLLAAGLVVLLPKNMADWDILQRLIGQVKYLDLTQGDSLDTLF